MRLHSSGMRGLQGDVRMYICGVRSACSAVPAVGFSLRLHSSGARGLDGDVRMYMCGVRSAYSAVPFVGFSLRDFLSDLELSIYVVPG